MSDLMRYFRWAFIVTGTGLVLALILGLVQEPTVAGAFQVLFVVVVLSILEISLSFDNAVVNASILKTMEPKWQHRFLTWGILIAVFGMRLIFPLAVVAIAASLGPWDALVLAATEPQEYEQIMEAAYPGIAAFGGAFLMMVAMKYFLDAEKDVHWLVPVERFLARFGNIEAVEIVIVLLGLYIFSTFIPAPSLDYMAGQVAGWDAMSAEVQALQIDRMLWLIRFEFLAGGCFGLLTFVTVEILGNMLEAGKETTEGVARGGAGAFLYLEIIDASFSFDGVIGAFALSNNLFIIAIGLGVGAMYVRSLTIMLVEKGTLAQYRYLENGAYWAIIALAIIMPLQTIVHVPEVITGAIGAGLIVLALLTSILYNRRKPQGELQAGGDI